MGIFIAAVDVGYYEAAVTCVVEPPKPRSKGELVDVQRSDA